MIYTNTTIPFYIEMLCRDFSDKTALTWKTKYRTTRISYRLLLNYSRKFALFLLMKNLKKSARVFLIGQNSPHWVTAFFGTELAGMTLVPADYNSSPSFIQKILEESKPEVFILNKALLSKLPENVKNENIIFLEDLFALIENLKPEELKDHSYYITDSDPAEIIFTSGTTDQPKGVVLTHRNIGSNIYNASRRIVISSGTKLVSILPLSHMFEQTAGLFTPLRQGGEIIYLQSMKPSSIKSALQEEKAEVMIVAPAFLNTFRNLIFLAVEKMGNDKIKGFKKGLEKSEKLPMSVRRFLFKKIIRELGSKIKFVVSGGSKLDVEIERFWNAVGIQVLQGYGLTETSPVITCTSLDENKVGSVGKILPHQNVTILKDGEIITCGDNVFHGYLDHPELNRSIFENGWFKTGDIGEIDEEGYLFIKGRKKNIIVAPSGLNIFPEDIESRINENHLIKDSIVLAVHEPKFYLYSFVLSEDVLDEKELNDILTAVNKNLADHQKIKTMIQWPEKDFPRTPTKKIIRREVEKISSGFKSTDSKITDLSIREKNEKSVLDKIIIIVSEITGSAESSISEKSRFVEDLGLDSINKLELLTKLEAEFLIDIDEEAFYKVQSVGEIIPFTEIRSDDENQKSGSTLSESRFGFLLKLIQSMIFVLIRIFSSMLFRVRSKRNQHLKNLNFPVIFVANHSSHLDFLSVMRALPTYLRRKLHTAAAHDYFFKGKENGNLLSFVLNIFPFYRKEMMRTNLLNIGKILDKHEHLLIFPEGTRSRTGEMQPFKEGIGMILNAMDVPCIPVKIENAFELLPPDKKIPKQGRVNISFGSLIRFKNDASYKEIADTLFKTIKEM